MAASPREAVAGADVVLSMVADDAASRAVWLGEDGALAGAARGSVLVESSTLTVGWTLELPAEGGIRTLTSRGWSMLNRAGPAQSLVGQVRHDRGGGLAKGGKPCLLH